jgi:hypothetical protein
MAVVNVKINRLDAATAATLAHTFAADTAFTGNVDTEKVKLEQVLTLFLEQLFANEDFQALLNAKAPNDFRAANYADAAPTWVPAGSLGIAIDTVTERVWWYYGGAWH